MIMHGTLGYEIKMMAQSDAALGPVNGRERAEAISLGLRP